MILEEKMTKDSMESRLKIIEKTWTAQTESFYREKETMLNEVLSFYGQAETKEDKKRVTDCLSKWNNSTNLMHDAVTALVEFLQNHAEDLLNGGIPCIAQLIGILSVRHHLKQNEKKCLKLFEKIAMARKPANEETTAILNNLLSIVLSTDKGISTFLKKGYASLAKYFTDLESYKHLNDAKKQVYQILKTLFNKTNLQKLKQTLQACFVEMDEPQKNSELFESLQICYESDLSTNLKSAYFKLIFQTLLITQLEDLEILQFFAIVSYLLAIPSSNFENSRIEQTLEITPTENPSNLPIWCVVLETIAKRPMNLNLELNNTSFIQWLKSVTTSLIKAEEFGVVQIDALTAMVQLDSSIIEPYLAKIFAKLFINLNNEEVLKSYQNFLLTSLGIFGRLQRTSKLLQKLMSAIAAGSPINSTNQLLFESFLQQLGKNSVVIASAQALNLIQLLMEQFQKCINCLQEDELNTTLLDAVSLIFCTILTNCRFICSSLPRSVVEQFTTLMDNFKDNLGQFGTLILQRPHDRKIMQPFLKICNVWGEYRVLVDLYATEVGPPTLSIDATPSDLSPILPFLKGEQWSILTERIANFGDRQCNQLLMKLLILKIRVANLSGGNSSVNLEAIAKYILEILKQNVHGLTIDETFSAEEFAFVFNALPSCKQKTLVKILFEQLIASDDAVFLSWMKHNTLLENPKFVELLFETIVREISESMQSKDLQQLLKSASLKSVSEDLKTSINAVLREASGNNENQLNDRVRKSLAALTSLPFGYIASFGDNPLIIVLGIMVALNSTQHLLPIFEKLLSYSKTLENSFDVGSCIRWLTISVPDRALRAPIVEQLVVKSTLNENGIKAFKQLIKNLENDSNINACEKLATQIHLHNAIRKCWRQGNDPEITKINDVIAKQRKKLNKSLHGALENGAEIANDCVLLDAYGIELMRLEREGKVDGIVALNFQSYLDRALKGVKKSINSPEQQSCLNFLTTVLKCSAALRHATSNQNFVFTIYKKLIGFENHLLWEHVCAAASEKEFQNIMKDVSKNVHLGLCPTDSWDREQPVPMDLAPLVFKISERCSKQWSDQYINVWKLFLHKSSGAKQKCCYSHLKRILTWAENLLPKAGRKHPESLLKWLKFLHHVVNLSILTIRPELEDYVMDVMMAFPESGTDFQEHFVAHLNIMGALISPQKIPAVRKMHMIFLVYQKLVRWLSRESDANGNLSADNISSRALAAFHLEKWIGLLVQRKDEFLVFPLYITELINAIASVTVYPPVKVHIRNAIFHLLAVMDEQQVRIVARNLNTGCQQILTSLHSEFVKFHKYKGKI